MLLKRGGLLVTLWQPRLFEVDWQNHCVRYSVPKKSNKAPKPKGAFLFSELTDVRRDDRKAFCLSFLRQQPGAKKPGKRYYLVARSDEEADEWVQTLEYCHRIECFGVEEASSSMAAEDHMQGRSKLILYSYCGSPHGWRVELVLLEKGIQFTMASPPGGMKSLEFLAINPRGQIPVLLHEGTVVRESMCIMEYLDNLVPKPALLPSRSGPVAERALFLSLYHRAPSLSMVAYPLMLHARRMQVSGVYYSPSLHAPFVSLCDGCAGYNCFRIR